MPRQPHREAPELASFLRRMARAFVRRAGEGDLEVMSALLDSIAALEEAAGEAARQLNAAGYSWTDIGREAGMKRQSAHQRWGKAPGSEEQ